MGKKYYCDFCKNTFKDSKIIRKNHLEGLKHKLIRKDYYTKFRDPRAILQEESLKSPCIRIMKNQECVFGSLCRFSHYTPYQIWELQQKVQQEDYNNWLKSQEKLEPTIEGFLQKRTERLIKSNIEYKPFWSYPVELENIPELPISLQKLNIYKIPTKFQEWG